MTGWISEKIIHHTWSYKDTIRVVQYNIYNYGTQHRLAMKYCGMN